MMMQGSHFLQYLIKIKVLYKFLLQDYDRANPVTQEAAINEWIELIESIFFFYINSIKLKIWEKKGIQLKMEGMPNPLVDNKNINNEIEEGKNPPQIPNLKINQCLANYANANLAKLNNMIAQAPQNQNVTNANSLVQIFIYIVIKIFICNLVTLFSSCPTTT